MRGPVVSVSHKGPPTITSSDRRDTSHDSHIFSLCALSPGMFTWPPAPLAAPNEVDLCAKREGTQPIGAIVANDSYSAASSAHTAAVAAVNVPN